MNFFKKLLVKELPSSQKTEVEEMCRVLRAACDRDWGKETPIQTANIAANALYWARQKVEELNDHIESAKRCDYPEHNRFDSHRKSDPEVIPSLTPKYHCPECWTWGHIHKRGCPLRDKGMSHHVLFTEEP